MKEYIQRNLKSEFLRNVLTLFSGTAIAQVIPILISPILSRLYSPADFGTMALFASITGIIGIIITGQYENAIVISKKDDDAVNVAALAGIITISISVVCLILVVFFRHFLCQLLKSNDLNYYMFLIPLSVLLTGVYQILNYWSSRKKQFRRLAIRQITQSISSSSVKLGVGLIKPSPGGLIAGNIIGQISATSVLCFLIWRDEKEQIRFIKKERIKQLAVEFKNFPIFNVPQAFLDSFSANSIIFIISSFFTATILGLYSFATSMVTFPMRILGNSITQVFFQKASEIHSNNHNLWPDIKKLIIRLALTGLPVFILILLFAPEIFSIVFGSKWHEAGVYAQILTPYLFATFIGAPISSIPMILNKQKQFFRISLIGNVGLPFLLFGLIKIFSDLKFSLICWSIAGIVFYAIVFFWIRFISKDQSNYCMNNNE